MTDYQIPTKKKHYKFEWKDVRILQLQLPVSAVLFYYISVQLPAGGAKMNLPTAASIGLTVLLMNTIVINLNTTGFSKLPPWMRLNETSFKKSSVACLILIGVLSFFVQEKVWKWGIGFLLATLFTVWLLTRLKRTYPKISLKEPVATLLYALSVWGAAAVVSEWEITLIWTFGVVFFLITFQSVLLHAHFQALNRQQSPNFAKWIGKEATKRLVYGIAALAVFLCAILVYKTPMRYAQRTAIVFGAISVVHAAIFINSKDPAKRNLLELSSEFTCLFPLFLI